MNDEEKAQEAIELVKQARGYLERMAERNDQAADILAGLDEIVEDLIELDFDDRGRIQEREEEEEDEDFDEDWDDEDDDVDYDDDDE